MPAEFPNRWQLVNYATQPAQAQISNPAPAGVTYVVDTIRLVLYNFSGASKLGAGVDLQYTLAGQTTYLGSVYIESSDTFSLEAFELDTLALAQWTSIEPKAGIAGVDEYLYAAGYVI